MDDHVRDNAATPGALGVWHCTALVMGNMIGSGVFLLPSALAAYGGISIVGWLVTASGAWVLALLFASLARTHSGSGGPYAFTRDGVGRFPAFLVAWGYWISLITGNAAIAVAMISYASIFLAPLSSLPWLGGLAAMAGVWFLTWVNVRGVRQAGQVQIVTVVLKVLPLLGIGLFGVLHLDPDHFVPFNRSAVGNGGAILATASLTLWAFMGLESATIPANDVKTPERTIPRATMLGVALATLIYVLCTVGVFGLIDPQTLAASNAPFADAARELWGEGAAFVVAAGAVVSCFGALNGWILNTGRIPYAAACDGLLPAALARLGRRHTPVFALVFSAVVTSVLIGMNSARGLVSLFQFAILLSTLAVLVPYLFSAVARIRLTLRAETRTGRTKTLAVSVAALVFSLAAIAGTGWTSIAYGTTLFIVGVPVYLWLVRRPPTH